MHRHSLTTKRQAMRLGALALVVLLCGGCQGTGHCLTDFRSSHFRSAGTVRSHGAFTGSVNCELAIANAGYCETNWTPLTSYDDGETYIEDREGLEELPAPPIDDEMPEVSAADVSELFPELDQYAELAVHSEPVPSQHPLAAGQDPAESRVLESVAFEEVGSKPFVGEASVVKEFEEFVVEDLVGESSVNEPSAAEDSLLGQVGEGDLVPTVVVDRTRAAVD